MIPMMMIGRRKYGTAAVLTSLALIAGLVVAQNLMARNDSCGDVPRCAASAECQPTEGVCEATAPATTAVLATEEAANVIMASEDIARRPSFLHRPFLKPHEGEHRSLLDTVLFVTSLHYGLSFGHLIMLAIALLLMYVSIAKKKEPFLLLPLAFGILLANLPGANLSAYIDPDQGAGLITYVYRGVRPIVNGTASPLYPPLIFLCIGAISDFSPLIASPRTALIGLGGQLGIFVAFGLFLLVQRFYPLVDINEVFRSAACVGIIGSSDGPTSIYTAARLGPDLLPVVAIAAFSYMGLVPFIQPPIMKLLTNAKERVTVMAPPKEVTRRQKLLFPIGLTIVTLLVVPTAGTLIGMLMLGNLIRECGIVDRYVDTLGNAAMNFMMLMLALSIGSSATADLFLRPVTIIVLILGLVAFASGTVGGVLVAKLLYYTTGGKVNPLIGNSGVSAMPMAARISQRLGQQYNPQNHLLMHAMGPIVSSTIGSAIVAGIFISLLSR